MWLGYISLSCCFKSNNVPNRDYFSRIISRNKAEQSHHWSPEKVTPWKQSSNPLMRCCWTLCLSWRMSAQEPQISESVAILLVWFFNEQESTLGPLHSESGAAWKHCQSDWASFHVAAGIKLANWVASLQFVLAPAPGGARSGHSHSILFHIIEEELQ